MCSTVSAQVFSNKGKEFWTGYGHNYYFDKTLETGYNSQQMVLYLSAEQAAKVTISVNGTTWTKTYTIPANTVIVSDTMPKGGIGNEDARLLAEGLSDKGIHIVSDVPIVVYAHVYGNLTSGSTMLLPVETYAYNYTSLNSEQNYPAGICRLWFFVTANEDNTKVRITPMANTMGGHTANAPFDVILNKGQIYNVMGETQQSDLSGSKIQSIEGPDGKCHPIGLFSGSSRTTVCGTAFAAGGDFIIQQMFPQSAWGMSYLTANTSSTDGVTIHPANKYRVYIKESGTIVRRNGALVSGLTNNSYYEYVSRTDDYITGSKPIMVAEFISSQGGCSSVGYGDPEMFCLSPIEQAISNVNFYSSNKEHILNNFLTLIIPKEGLASLKIDGSQVFGESYPHPNLTNYQVVRMELPVTPMQHTIQSDTGFTAITYGLGSNETYGYNAGTYVKNLNVIPQILNNTSNKAVDSVCSKTPFSLSIQTLYLATALTWHLSEVPDMLPGNDITISNPVPETTTTINGKTYYKYSLPGNYKLTAAGSYLVPVSIFSEAIDNCSHSDKVSISVPVKAGPLVSFTLPANACIGDTLQLNATTPDTSIIDSWQWTFSNQATPGDTTPTTQLIGTKSGADSVNIQVSRNTDGCLGDSTLIVHINALPVVQFTLPSAICMPGGGATFTNQSTLPDGEASQLKHTWQFGDGTTASTTNPIHYYTTAGTYTVQLRSESAVGCSDSAAQTLKAFVVRPSAKIGIADSTLCLGTEASLTDQSTKGTNNIITWNWSLGNGNTSTDKNPVVEYTTTGDYPIQLYVTDNQECVSDTVESTVHVYALPQVDAGPDLITDAKTPITLQASASDPSYTFHWTPPAGLSSTAVLQPIANPPATQAYFITVTTKEGCTASDSMLLKIFTEIHVPNAFTPNNDGINDKWQIPGLSNFHDANVEVYNRWGQVVFRSRGYDRPWDGTLNGSQLPMGAYFYLIVPNQSGYDKQAGSVLILR